MILKLADHFRFTSEVYYPDPSNYKQVTVVRIARARRDSYEITEENRAARLAAEPRPRYSKRVLNGKAAARPRPLRPKPLEAPAMATRTAAKRPTRAKAKPAPEPEPEELEEELEELEDEAEVDEDAEEAEVDEDAEEDEDVEEDEDEEDEDEEDEAEDEAEPAEEPEKDYRIYAEKPITATMEDFAEWLSIEVGPLEEMEPVRIAALAGTLRMEFQKSQFCKDRREERRNAAKAAKTTKAKPVATKTAPAKAVKSTAKAAPAPAATAKKTATKAAAAPATPARKTGAAAGRPAPRAADRPVAKKPTARRGKAAQPAEEPF